jgi:hypothetical protein
MTFTRVSFAKMSFAKMSFTKMSFAKIIFAATAGAAFLIGALPGAAFAQEWRGGEFRRFETERHRFGEFCTFRAQAHGIANGNLFSGRPGGRAEARAIRHWEEQVAIAYGPRFASWGLAEGKTASCARKNLLEIECVVAANPCRVRG